MSAAEQAFLLTGELFVLSFVAIFAFWFADKLRRNFTGKYWVALALLVARMERSAIRDRTTG